MLWTPVFIGCGIALYFSLPEEPPAWFAPALLVPLWSAVYIARRRGGLALALTVLSLLSIGLAAGSIRTFLVQAPVLSRATGALDVAGRIVQIQSLPSGARVVMTVTSLGAPDTEPRPDFIRLRFRAPLPAGARPGDELSVRVRLLPPPPPVAPGAYDFQRALFFARIGAIGFPVGAATLRKHPPDSISVIIERLRTRVSGAIRRTLSGDSGAVADALLTGRRGGVSPETLAAIRDAGLAHLLAISGLHIGLVAGLLFYLIRLALACWPYAALAWPIKKIAAASAIAAALFYLLLAGGSVPTQRAFLMILIVMAAIIIDRVAVTLRLVALAALVILLLRPEALLSASFQLSFAAVTALVAAYEALQARKLLRLSREAYPTSRTGTAARYIGGIALTTIIASLATAPLALHHFNHLALYGVLANLLAVPIAALWIMPWGVFSLLLMPFGLEHLALIPMGWGVDAMLMIARAVAAWPGAVRIIATPPDWSLACAASGALWLCLWRGRWRLWGMPLLLIGMTGPLFSTVPDILISADGRLLAIRGADGRLLLSDSRRGRFSASVWQRRAGTRDAGVWPKAGVSPDGSIRCDWAGCIFNAGDKKIALLRDAEAMLDDCALADIVIAPELDASACRPAARVVDKSEIERFGSHALYFSGGNIRIMSDKRIRGRRPWVPGPPDAVAKPLPPAPVTTPKK